MSTLTRPDARARTTVLHLSDVHATAGGPLYGSIDGIQRMLAASEYAQAAGVTPEAIVISGDLIERGNTAAYPALREALLGLEASWGVPVLTVLGNHDDRVAARILPGHELPEDAAAASSSAETSSRAETSRSAETSRAGDHRTAGHRADAAIPRAVRVGGWRFVLLDSSSGSLGTEQLAWLEAELTSPGGRGADSAPAAGSGPAVPPEGTVVVMHHPPLGSPLPMLARAGLRDSADFLDLVEGTDVRAILSGHFHHPLAATTRGVHVSVGPALAYHQVMDAEPGTVSGFDRSMFSLVHLTADGVSASSVGVEAPASLFTLTPAPASS